MKYDDEQFAPVESEFPDSNNLQYHYEPKPMRPVPPITAHEFSRRFHACYRPRPHLHSWFHRCNRPCSSRNVLPLIPQRNARLEVCGEQREEFWGILARERRSFFRVAIYNGICILPCVIFFFMWLFAWGHTSDLQNASAPLIVTFTALAMFWSFVFMSSPAFQIPAY
jgi:hypothetical protein